MERGGVSYLLLVVALLFLPGILLSCLALVSYGSTMLSFFSRFCKSKPERAQPSDPGPSNVLGQGAGGGSPSPSSGLPASGGTPPPFAGGAGGPGGGGLPPPSGAPAQSGDGACPSSPSAAAGGAQLPPQGAPPAGSGGLPEEPRPDQGSFTYEEGGRHSADRTPTPPGFDNQFAPVDNVFDRFSSLGARLVSRIPAYLNQGIGPKIGTIFDSEDDCLESVQEMGFYIKFKQGPTVEWAMHKDPDTGDTGVTFDSYQLDVMEAEWRLEQEEEPLQLTELKFESEAAFRIALDVLHPPEKSVCNPTTVHDPAADTGRITKARKSWLDLMESSPARIPEMDDPDFYTDDEDLIEEPEVTATSSASGGSGTSSAQASGLTAHASLLLGVVGTSANHELVPYVAKPPVLTCKAQPTGGGMDTVLSGLPTAPSTVSPTGPPEQEFASVVVGQRASPAVFFNKKRGKRSITSSAKDVDSGNPTSPLTPADHGASSAKRLKESSGSSGKMLSNSGTGCSSYSLENVNATKFFLNTFQAQLEAHPLDVTSSSFTAELRRALLEGVCSEESGNAVTSSRVMWVLSYFNKNLMDAGGHCRDRTVWLQCYSQAVAEVNLQFSADWMSTFEVPENPQLAAFEESSSIASSEGAVAADFLVHTEPRIRVRTIESAYSNTVRRREERYREFLAVRKNARDAERESRRKIV